VVGEILNEIQQSKPFATLETETLIALELTADRLTAELAQLFKAWDLSPTQYNVLRILRGAEPDGLACGRVGERMVTHDPDMTRLLDRMEKRALVTRQRGGKDRRVVTTRITGAGLDLLKQLDEPVENFNRQRLGHLGPERLRTLLELLALIRNQQG
jgi:DNA-binding MarR family transcriptional regulator